MPVQQAGEFAETGEYDINFINLPGSMDVSGVSRLSSMWIMLCNDYDMSVAITILGQLQYYCLIFLYTLMLLFTPIFMYVLKSIILQC